MTSLEKNLQASLKGLCKSSSHLEVVLITTSSSNAGIYKLIAQLDRASAFGADSYGFKSRLAGQNNSCNLGA